MLHWRRIKVYARSVWDVIIIITAFCLANDGHLLFSAQWLQKPLGGGGWWEVLTRGWLIYWASSSPSSHNHRAALGCVCFSPPPLFIPPFSPQASSWHIHPSFSFFIILTFTCSPPLLSSHHLTLMVRTDVLRKENEWVKRQRETAKRKSEAQIIWLIMFLSKKNIDVHIWITWHRVCSLPQTLWEWVHELC